MSWDVYLIRTKTNSEAINEIEYSNILKFEKKEMIQELQRLANELDLFLTDLDKRYVHLRGNNWSIEFDFWDGKEPYINIDMEIRGSKEPVEVLERLKMDLNTRIVDTCTYAFWMKDSRSGFPDWNKLNDKIKEIGL